MRNQFTHQNYTHLENRVNKKMRIGSQAVLFPKSTIAETPSPFFDSWEYLAINPKKSKEIP